MDVEPDGRDTLIRYSWIGYSDVICQRKIVKHAEVRLRNRAPASLVRRNNPCKIQPGELAAAIAEHPRAGAHFETISFGIVAQCGATADTLELPIQESVDFKALRRARPDMARLWYLTGDLQSFFGAEDIFHNQTEAKDLELQRAGEKTVPSSHPEGTTPDSPLRYTDLAAAQVLQVLESCWKTNAARSAPARQVSMLCCRRSC